MEFYLDNDIRYDYEFTTEIYQTLYGEYDVYFSYNGTLYEHFFKGRVTVADNAPTMSIHLNDIFASKRFVSKCIVPDNANGFGELKAKNETDYNYHLYFKVEVRFPQQPEFNSEQLFDVIMVYRYPTYTENTLCYFGSPQTSAFPSLQADNRRFTICREGYDAQTFKSTLLPRIPHGLPIPFKVIFGGLWRTFNVVYGDEDLHNIGRERTFNNVPKGLPHNYVIVPQSMPTDAMYVAIDTETGIPTGRDILICENLSEEGSVTDTQTLVTNLWHSVNQYTTLTEQGAEAIVASLRAGNSVELYRGSTANCQALMRDLMTYFECSIEEEEEGELAKIAKIDECAAEYYLLWYDRFGGIQCQPFEGKNIYSESIGITEVRNQIGMRRVGSSNINPKWKLISNWITDEEYPIYESMFVSPYVTLYNSKTGALYSVMITDKEYTEKTYRNQNNNLVNLTINVELAKSQKIFN